MNLDVASKCKTKKFPCKEEKVRIKTQIKVYWELLEGKHIFFFKKELNFQGAQQEIITKY